MPSQPAPAPETRARLRALPSVAAVLAAPEAQSLAPHFPPARVADAVRAELAQARAALLRGECSAETAPSALAVQAAARLRAEDHQTRLRRVVNATGIVIHTNMGRAPLAEPAIDAVLDAARHYSNLEFDLQTGRRGDRASAAESALCRLTGAEAAVIVNNAAAAVLLALATVVADTPLHDVEGLGVVGRPKGRVGQAHDTDNPAPQPEIVLSRGELVEIGGSFRVPDILRQSGARLVEVGTTNRTHLRDYAQAITPATRAILKVHASNYRIVGYTKSVPLADLAPLADAHNLVLMEDLGSGALLDLTAHGLPHAEPTPAASIAAGAHLVAFSADKLLGGPQAGIVIGRKTLIDQLSTHPLYRALRPDKLCLAALAATLHCYEQGPAQATESIPVLRMLTTPEPTLRARAETLQSMLSTIPNLTAALEPTHSYAGGGTLPELALPSWSVRISLAEITAVELAARFRTGALPVVGVVADDALRFDMRTLRDEELPIIATALRSIHLSMENAAR